MDEWIALVAGGSFDSGDHYLLVAPVEPTIPVLANTYSVVDLLDGSGNEELKRARHLARWFRDRLDGFDSSVFAAVAFWFCSYCYGRTQARIRSRISLSFLCCGSAIRSIRSGSVDNRSSLCEAQRARRDEKSAADRVRAWLRLAIVLIYHRFDA